MGEHTLAIVEHQAVLELLEASGKGLSRLQHNNGKYDDYVDTLVNLHRQANNSLGWTPSVEKRHWHLQKSGDSTETTMAI